MKGMVGHRESGAAAWPVVLAAKTSQRPKAAVRGLIKRRKFMQNQGFLGVKKSNSPLARLAQVCRFNFRARSQAAVRFKRRRPANQNEACLASKRRAAPQDRRPVSKPALCLRRHERWASPGPDAAFTRPIGATGRPTCTARPAARVGVGIETQSVSPGTGSWRYQVHATAPTSSSAWIRSIGRKGLTR